MYFGSNQLLPTAGNHTKTIRRRKKYLPISFSKGQLISKWFFGVIDFFQKTNERIRLYYYDTTGGLVFVRFLEEIEDTKKTFRN